MRILKLPISLLDQWVQVNGLVEMIAIVPLINAMHHWSRGLTFSSNECFFSVIFRAELWLNLAQSVQCSPWKPHGGLAIETSYQWKDNRNDDNTRRYTSGSKFELLPTLAAACMKWAVVAGEYCRLHISPLASEWYIASSVASEQHEKQLRRGEHSDRPLWRITRQFGVRSASKWHCVCHRPLRARPQQREHHHYYYHRRCLLWCAKSINPDGRPVGHQRWHIQDWSKALARSTSTCKGSCHWGTLIHLHCKHLLTFGRRRPSRAGKYSLPSTFPHLAPFLPQTKCWNVEWVQ